VEIIPQGDQLPFLDNSASLAGFVTPRAPPAGVRITVNLATAVTEWCTAIGTVVTREASKFLHDLEN
jgi:hypothetical protein